MLACVVGDRCELMPEALEMLELDEQKRAADLLARMQVTLQAVYRCSSAMVTLLAFIAFKLWFPDFNLF